MKKRGKTKAKEQQTKESQANTKKNQTDLETTVVQTSKELEEILELEKRYSFFHLFQEILIQK